MACDEIRLLKQKEKVVLNTSINIRFLCHTKRGVGLVKWASTDGIDVHELEEYNSVKFDLLYTTIRINNRRVERIPSSCAPNSKSE